MLSGQKNLDEGKGTHTMKLDRSFPSNFHRPLKSIIGTFFLHFHQFSFRRNK